MDSMNRTPFRGAPQGQNMGQVRPATMMNNTLPPPPTAIPTPPAPTTLPVGQTMTQRPQATFTPAKPPQAVGRPTGGMMAGHAMGRARG